MVYPRARRILYWACTVLTALLFAVPGAALLARNPHFAGEMSRLGYPAYFLAVLGSFKLLGAAVILLPRLPRLKEWAYAGMLFDIAGAVVSRATMGDEPMRLALPIFIAGLALLSWQLRPADRRLSGERALAA
jgi:uncharacterized membrane protein YphA (DoxX/SURF4 family)